MNPSLNYIEQRVTDWFARNIKVMEHNKTLRKFYRNGKHDWRIKQAAETPALIPAKPFLCLYISLLNLIDLFKNQINFVKKNN